MSPDHYARDRSMTLIRELTMHPLDPDYELTAQRKSRTLQPGRWSIAVSVVVLAASACLATVAVKHLTSPEPTTSREDLSAQVQSRIDTSAQLDEHAKSLAAQVKNLQNQQLALSNQQDLLASIASLERLGGYDEVRGSGLELRLDDAPEKPEDEPLAGHIWAGKIRDSDLQWIINGLWASGAQAISVNGVRLTSHSAVRSARDAIFVALQPLSPPYTIIALGDGDAMSRSFTSSAFGQYLQRLAADFKIQWQMTPQSSVTVAGAAPDSVDFARPVPSGAQSEVSTSSSSQAKGQQ